MRLLDSTLVEDVAFVDPQGAVVVLEAANDYAAHAVASRRNRAAGATCAVSCRSARPDTPPAGILVHSGLVRVMAADRCCQRPPDQASP